MPKTSSTSPKVYKFVHRKDVWLQTNITDRAPLDNEFLKYEPSGKITIKGAYKNGYAWDGCTPKKETLDMVFGTPDGRLDFTTEKPITYYASMVHDIIYQFSYEVDISKKEADIIFKLILTEANFYWAKTYYRAVRWFGGKSLTWKRTSTQEAIEISEMSWRTETNSK